MFIAMTSVIFSHFGLKRLMLRKQLCKKWQYGVACSHFHFQTRRRSVCPSFHISIQICVENVQILIHVNAICRMRSLHFIYSDIFVSHELYAPTKLSIEYPVACILPTVFLLWHGFRHPSIFLLLLFFHWHTLHT